MNQINFKPDLLKPTALLEYHDAVMCMMVYNMPIDDTLLGIL